ncbi:hypothetical protein KY360_06940 [Candidatus Woesearchaeota archaeon]|nr:hypothetical protein [Candidatus Woesearchaeota archaeon]
MKKLIVLFMLSIFILSAVPVYAPYEQSTESISAKDYDAANPVEDTGDEPTPTLISAEPVVYEPTTTSSGEDTPLLTCIKRKVEAGLTREEARKRCAATVVATAVSTADAYTNCLQNKIKAGLTKEEARLKCGGQAVSQIREKAQACIEKYQEEGLTLEEAKRKCAGLGLERAKEIIEENLEGCIEKIQERYPDISDEDAKTKCAGLVRARVTKVTNFARLHSDEIKKVALMERARVKELEGLSEAKIKAQLKNYAVKIVKKADLYRKRQIAENELEDSKERYRAAKERYEEAKERRELNKEEFLATKEQLKACKDVDSEECDELEENIIISAKEFLIESAELAIEHLNKIKERVESSDDISEEEAAKIIEDIDNAIEALQNAIEEVNAAETKEEVKEAAKTIDSVWKRIKNRAKLHAARVVHAKVGEIIVRSRQLEAKLDRILERMEDEGIEVEDIDAKVGKFSDKIEEARVLHKHSTEMFIEAKESANPGLVKEARELAKKAHEALKEANRILIDIIKAIKEAGGSLDVEEEEEVEVVEEVEEEEEEEELADSTTVEEYEEEEIEEPEEEEEETEEEDIEAPEEEEEVE